MIRLLKWIVLPLLLLLLVTIGVAGYLVASESGSRQLLALAQRFAPGELQWQRVEGRLADALRLQGLDYRQPDGLAVKIDSAELRWHPGALPGRLHLETLALAGVDLYLPPSRADETPSAPIELPTIELPIDVDLENIELTDLRLYPDGATDPVVIDRARLSLQGAGSQWRLETLEIDRPDAGLHLAGTVETRDDYPLDLNLDWQYRHATHGVFRGEGSVDGSPRRLRLSQQVDGPVRLTLASELSDLLTAPSWDAELKLQADDLGAFAPALAGSPVEATLHSEGRLDDYRLRGDLTSETAPTGPLRLELAARGDRRRLRLEQANLRPDASPGELSVSGEVFLDDLRLDIDGQWQRTAWPLQADAPEWRLPRGTLALQGRPDDLRLRFSSELDGPRLGRLELSADAAIDAGVLRLTEFTLNSPDGPLTLTAQGHFDPASRALQASGKWQALGWPLSGPAVFQSPAGRFEIAGRLDAYRLSAEAETSGSSMPAAKWRLVGEGSDKALKRFDLEGELLGGRLRAEGQAAWSPAPQWRVRLRAENIDPGRQWPDFPGDLTLALESDGQIGAEGPRLAAVIDTLSGRFRGQPVSGEGRLRLDGATLAVEKLVLRHGASRLEANGRLGDRWALDWRVRAPDLATLAPALKGRVQASGELKGTAAEPMLKADIDLRDLQLGETALQRLGGSLRIDASGRQRSTVNLSGSGLRLAGQRWDRLSLEGGGVPRRHRLELRLDGEPAKLALTLDGGLKGAVWEGRLAGLDARETPLGDWALDEPAPLRVAADAATLGKACLQSEPARLCVDGGWDKRRGAKGRIEVRDFDSARLRRFLPPDIELATALDADIDAAVAGNGEPEAEAALRLRPGTLTVPGEIEPVVVRFGQGELDAVLRGDRADVELTLDLGSLGKVASSATLAGLSRQPTVKGALDARLDDLAIVSAFAPSLQAVAGRLLADLRFRGPLAQPRVQGRLAVDGFEAEVPEASLKIREGRFELASDGDGPLRVDGSARSGEGALKLTGVLDPATRRLDLKLRGERFQVVATRNVSAVISPDMRIVMDGAGMRVEGELRVPSAHVRAGGGGDGKLVKVSSDVVIVDENGVAEKKAPPGNFSLDLRVVLGDDILVEAADFSGKLSGGLRVTQKPGLAPRGTGEIEVVNGDYVIYGQQLTIQRGRILFSGGPVDNPRLDLDVARRVEAYDVLAGARIRGTAQAPILQLYSEPAMPDSSILSYMLLGQPPGTKGGSYTLGKYLTPDLYVGYGIGLFNAINTFNMRYRLTDKLALQAASGAASSADLIYTIER